MPRSDIGVSIADLRAIHPRVAGADELMDRMLRARGLDPEAVRRAFAAVMRDMDVTCARCRESGTCQRELAAGTAAEDCHEFCGNAGTIDALSASVS
jgi:hypothetical protein